MGDPSRHTGPWRGLVWSLAAASIVNALACSDDGDSSSFRQCSARTECLADEQCIDGLCVWGPGGVEDDAGTPSTDGDIPDMDASAAGPEAGTTADATTDATASDVGPLDAGQPPCRTPDCNQCADLYPDALLCQTFDEVPEAPWVALTSPGASVAIEQARFRAGGGALVGSLGQPAGAAAAASYRVRLGESIDSGDIFGRVYAYLPSTESIADYVVLVNLSNQTDDKVSLDIAENGSVVLNRLGGSLLASTANSFPTDRWTCLEFHVRISEPGVDGMMEFWIDGQLADFLRPADSSAPAGGYDVVRVGLGLGPMSAATVLLDEFVLSTDERIGCIP